METLKIFENKLKTLELKITSVLQTINFAAIDPLWELMEMAKLSGKYHLVVTQKVRGADGLVHKVKVVGLAGDMKATLVKFQLNAGECYEARLSSQIGDVSASTGSILKEKLHGVAGLGWFDPNQPKVKVSSHTNGTPAPLQSIEKAFAAAVKPVAVVAPVAKEEKRTVKGLSSNRKATKEIFEQMIKTPGLIVDSKSISNLIIYWAYGPGSNMPSQCTGSVVKSWKKYGWLEEAGKKQYRITASAIREFGLIVPAGQLVEVANSDKGSPAIKPTMTTSPAATSISATSPVATPSIDLSKIDIGQLKEFTRKIRVSRERLVRIKAEIVKLRAEQQELHQFLDSPDCSKISALMKELAGS